MMRVVITVCCGLLCAQAFGQEDETVSSDAIVELLSGDQVTRAIVVREKPDPAGLSIDLKIEFEFDSSRLTPTAAGQLDQLLSALANPKLAAFRFGVIGHTDAKGDADYNSDLSLRRARSVVEYLTRRGISPDRLDAQGMGEAELLYPHKPDDPGNRRVEIINRGQQSD
jgi:outer membrane protein OmpA-like peptidoglycan-associated protein